MKDIEAENIVNVCVTPCTAKKAEIRRPELNASSQYWDIPGIRDTDYCITTRELARWMTDEGLDFDALEDSPFDEVFGRASGGGIIFGNTGGGDGGRLADSLLPVYRPQSACYFSAF